MDRQTDRQLLYQLFTYTDYPIMDTLFISPTYFWTCPGGDTWAWPDGGVGRGSQPGCLHDLPHVSCPRLTCPHSCPGSVHVSWVASTCAPGPLRRVWARAAACCSSGTRVLVRDSFDLRTLWCMSRAAPSSLHTPVCSPPSKNNGFILPTSIM